MKSVLMAPNPVTDRLHKIKSFGVQYLFHIIDSIGVIIANILIGAVNLLVDISVRFVRKPVGTIVFSIFIYAILRLSLDYFGYSTHIKH